MDGYLPYEFIGFGAMDSNFPYELIGFLYKVWGLAVPLRKAVCQTTSSADIAILLFSADLLAAAL